MRISDSIADFISELLRTEGAVELQRNLLADRFNCVPSQINYVISTRFTPEHGYVVESRRGGGGYIRITRLASPREVAMMHVVNSIGEGITDRGAAICLKNLSDAGLISPAEQQLISAAADDHALRAVPAELRDRVRADILKRCIMRTAH
ncbi:MAG: CtsR family transcriptional regulator [Clostridia bacterium]|nr:CtsR family transcriptional regulator [Clostridia bacterium]